MIEMRYSTKRISPPVVLEANTYRNYSFFILNLGTHPCAYVEVPEGSKYHGVDYDNIPIDCHGGLTYSADRLIMVEHDGWFIGWDYAHWGDYDGYMPDATDKRHTTDEMIKDCKNVIDQLVDLESVEPCTTDQK